MYVDHFIQHKVRGIVRLNDQFYHPKCFTEVGMEHLDIPFIDGGVPSCHIVEKFLQFLDKHLEQSSAVFVHCR